MAKLVKLNQALDPAPKKQEIMVGVNSVRYLTESMPGTLGSTSVGLLGPRNGEHVKVAVVDGIGAILTALIASDLHFAKVKYHDLGGATSFDNLDYYVAEESIRLVKPSINHFVIEFIDGSELPIKDLGDLAGTVI